MLDLTGVTRGYTLGLAHLTPTNGAPITLVLLDADHETVQVAEGIEDVDFDDVIERNRVHDWFLVCREAGAEYVVLVTPTGQSVRTADEVERRPLLGLWLRQTIAESQSRVTPALSFDIPEAA